MADSRKLFDTASPEVITFLIDRIANSHFSPSTMDQLLAQGLGDYPVVQSQVLDADGNYSIISQDFSKQILPLLRNSNLFNTISPIGDLFSKWCRKDFGYKTDVIRTLDDHESTIAFFIDFLEVQIKELDLDIRNPSERAFKTLDEIEGKEVGVDARIERMKKEKGRLENLVSRLENKETREADSALLLKAADLSKTYGYSRQPEAFQFIDWMKNEILNRITVHAI